MRADAAEMTQLDSAREVTKAAAVKGLVLACRNALQRGLTAVLVATNSGHIGIVYFCSCDTPSFGYDMVLLRLLRPAGQPYTFHGGEAC